MSVKAGQSSLSERPDPERRTFEVWSLESGNIEANERSQVEIDQSDLDSRKHLHRRLSPHQHSPRRTDLQRLDAESLCPCALDEPLRLSLTAQHDLLPERTLRSVSPPFANEGCCRKRLGGGRLASWSKGRRVPSRTLVTKLSTEGPDSFSVNRLKMRSRSSSGRNPTGLARVGGRVATGEAKGSRGARERGLACTPVTLCSGLTIHASRARGRRTREGGGIWRERGQRAFLAWLFSVHSAARRKLGTLSRCCRGSRRVGAFEQAVGARSTTSSRASFDFPASTRFWCRENLLERM